MSFGATIGKVIRSLSHDDQALAKVLASCEMMKTPVNVFCIDASERVTQLCLGYIERHIEQVAKIVESHYPWKQSLETRHSVLCFVHATHRTSCASRMSSSPTVVDSVFQYHLNRVAYRFLTLEELIRYDKIKPVPHDCMVLSMYNTDHRVFDRLCDGPYLHVSQQLSYVHTSVDWKCNPRCLVTLRKRIGYHGLKSIIWNLIAFGSNNSETVVNETLFKLLLVQAITPDELAETAGISLASSGHQQ